MNKKLEEEVCKHGKKIIIKQHTRQNPIFCGKMQLLETQTSRKWSGEEQIVTLKFSGMESRLAEEHIVKGEGLRQTWYIFNSAAMGAVATYFRFLICKMGIMLVLRVWERIKCNDANKVQSTSPDTNKY